MLENIQNALCPDKIEGKQFEKFFGFERKINFIKFSVSQHILFFKNESLDAGRYGLNLRHRAGRNEAVAINALRANPDI